MDQWKTIEPNVWKPVEKGDAIVGVLLNKEPKDENTRLSARYQIENENGLFLIWGCTVLDDRMKYVKVGSKIRITFDGKTRNKRNQEVNLYKVEISEVQEPYDLEENIGNINHVDIKEDRDTVVPT